MICFSGGKFLSFLYSKSPIALLRFKFPLILPSETFIKKKYHNRLQRRLFYFPLVVLVYDLHSKQHFPTLTKIIHYFF